LQEQCKHIVLLTYITLAQNKSKFKVPALLYCILNMREGASCFAIEAACWKVKLLKTGAELLRLRAP